MRMFSSLLIVALSACGPEEYQRAATVAVSRGYDPDVDGHYFNAPWPDDRRLAADGKVTTEGFPNPSGTTLAKNIFQTGDHLVSGWGLQAPIYIPLSGPIDTASLPASPQASLATDASVYLIPLSGAGQGERVPLDWHFYAAATLFLPGNVLVLRPVPGFPLEPRTKYAAVITTRLKDAAGAPVGPEEPLWRLLGEDRGDVDAAQAAYFGPLLDVLGHRGVDKTEIAGAVLFTTQPVLDELLILRDFLLAQPAPDAESLVLERTRATYFVFEGTYRAPNLQHGVLPYLTTGGNFVYDAAGAPTVGAVEHMRVAIAVPRGAQPADGFPVVIYSHGTGGDFESFIGDVADDLAAAGIASVGIDQVLHVPRAPAGGGCFGQDVEICFFNPVNVVAARNNVRQAALDNFMLRKLLAALTIAPSLDPEGRTVRFDLRRLGYFGHSQGGLTGALYAAVDPALAGAVLSGAGGHLTTTIIERKDPIDLKELAEGPLLLNLEGKESLDPFHPVMALVQTLAEVADPMNYARYWVKRPTGAPKHLYVTSGLLDPFTPAFGAEAMAAAGGIPQLGPQVRQALVYTLRGIAPVAAPVAGNLAPESGGPAVTAVLRQFPDDGHYPVFGEPARVQWRPFLTSLVATGQATIP